MDVTRSCTALVLGAALVLTGCGGTSSVGPGSTGTPPPATTTQEPEMSEPTAAPGDDAATTAPPIDPQALGLPLGSVPESITKRPEVQEAVADLARRMDVLAEQVSVAGYAEVTWPDGSLGCPEKGKMYTMALVPGRQLILQVDQAYASYHSGERGTFSYCPTPTPPTSGDTR